jgi:radical SAM protein with 4Fe4S-binding SPASM domain
MCNIWEIYRKDPTNYQTELTLSEIKTLFSQSTYLQSLDEIVITGGEPFLHKDLAPMAAFFMEVYPPATLVIISNGFSPPLISGKLKEIMALAPAGRLPVLVFSLDGLGEDHDRIRGEPDGFKRVLASINAVREIAQDIRLTLSFTVMRDNYHTLPEVYQLAKSLDMTFTMRFAEISQAYYDNASLDKSWSEAELGRVEGMVHDIVTDLERQRGLVPRLFNPDTYFFDKMVAYKRTPQRLFKCFSGTHSFFLDPWGNVYACIFGPESSWGNIKKVPFDQLWQSRLATDCRQFIADERCHCWTECEVLPSLQRGLVHVKDNLKSYLARPGSTS